MKFLRHLFLANRLLLALSTSPPASAVESPFENQLLRIAEILGSLHYLRNLCGETGSEWRDQMEALLAAEAPDEARRARFVGRFAASRAPTSTAPLRRSRRSTVT